MAFIPTSDLIAASAANLAIRDAVRPGDVALDVGAYTGWLTALMSRLVGPRGHVIAFEPDRDNLEICRNYVYQMGTNNWTLVNAALSNQVGTRTFFVDDSNRQASTFLPNPQSRYSQIEVTSLTLDHYLSANNMMPTVIKIDAEGAEFEILEGGSGYIRWRKPILILEQQPHDKRCAEFLAQFGYAGFDAVDYQPFNNREYPPESVNTDVIYFFPGERFVEAMFQKEEAAYIDAPTFSRTPTSVVSEAFPLQPGRYVIHVQFEPGADNGWISQRVTLNETATLTRDDGDKHWLWRYRRIPFHLHLAASVKIEFHASDPVVLDSMTFGAIRILRFPGLSRPARINEL